MKRYNIHIISWSTASLILLVGLVCMLLTDVQAGCRWGVQPIASVQEYDDVRCKDMSALDLSDRPNLPATLQFNIDTIWPEPNRMPPGCDPNVIMTNGMNPGLGVRALHQQGITGAGINVAIIDQPTYLDHPEFAGKILAYYDAGCGGDESSMHGPAVTSLLVGTNCGTAPDANVYYAAAPSWLNNAAYEANSLDWIITQNQTLPDSQKIRMVSVSAFPSRRSADGQLWDEACARAKAAGIYVLDVSKFTGACWYDANDPENVAKCTPGFPYGQPSSTPDKLLVPSWPRTVAEATDGFEGDYGYIYGRNGVSWTIPYCAGILAMGWQLHPELKAEQMVDILYQTAYVHENGAKIINPQEFISFWDANRPNIKVSPKWINFYSIPGSPTSESHVLSIRNGGLATLNWVIDYDCNWLDVDPNAGTSTSWTDVTEVTLSITAIRPPGIHTCELTVSDPCAMNSPLTIPVALYVLGDEGAGQLRLVPSEYATIQAAIDGCNNGDVVIVEPNTYTGPGNRDLDFKGKAITVRSIEPNNPDVVAATIIDCQGAGRGFYFHNDEGPDSVLNGLTITGGHTSSGGAILSMWSSPAIMNCVIVGNSADSAGGIQNISGSNPVLVNCTFSKNSAVWLGGAVRNHTSGPALFNCVLNANSAKYGGAMQNENSSSNPTLVDCTLAYNSASEWGGAICNATGSAGATPILTNCILWANTDKYGPDEAAQIDGGAPILNYSCLQDWTGRLGGIGNIDADPCFVDTTSPDPNQWDFHLQSTVGRWDPNQNQWLTDANTSRCIDAGDPNSDWTVELWPHGKRINMGAFGGTPQASMSLSNVGNIADLNNSDFVNWQDLSLLVDRWLSQQVLLPEDLNRNGIVNFSDFAIFAQNWLWEQ